MQGKIEALINDRPMKIMALRPYNDVFRFLRSNSNFNVPFFYIAIYHLNFSISSIGRPVLWEICSTVNPIDKNFFALSSFS